jgi:hypothetical protein
MFVVQALRGVHDGHYHGSFAVTVGSLHWISALMTSQNVFPTLRLKELTMPVMHLCKQGFKHRIQSSLFVQCVQDSFECCWKGTVLGCSI